MRYLIPGVVVLAAVALFFVQRSARAPELPGVEDPRGVEVARHVSQPVAGAADTRIVPVAARAALSVRAAVAAAPEPEAESDPCAEILKALQVSDAARAVLERERDELRDQVMLLTHELWAVQFPEGTPYGALLASGEVDQLDARTLASIKSWLDIFPIILLPGEATPAVSG